MLALENAVLLVIDVQEKLIRAIYQKDELVDNLQRLVKGAKVLGVPVMMTEQYPQGLGATIPEISQLLPEIQPLSKITFSCCADEKFLSAFESLGRKQVLISGIESHVCVYQTVLDLMASGCEVYVVADTISSRKLENKEIGLGLMKQFGAVLTSTEAALFELLKVAGGDKFKEISRIVR